MGAGNLYRDMILKRTGLPSNELQCPREKSDMTPCIARDGDSAMAEDFKCVGCGENVNSLIDKERKKEK